MYFKTKDVSLIDDMKWHLRMLDSCNISFVVHKFPERLSKYANGKRERQRNKM